MTWSVDVRLSDFVNAVANIEAKVRWLVVRAVLPWGQNTQDFLQISATYTFLKKVLTYATF